jgi:hypothetical protein
MSAFEKLLSQHLFVIGTFFQVNWDNPLYLDKTGAAILKIGKRLDRWRGDAAEFEFYEPSGLYNGRVSMYRYWVRQEPQEFWTPDLHARTTSLSKHIEQDLRDFAMTYDVLSVSRVGLRHQAIFGKITDQAMNEFASLCGGRAEVLITKYKAKSQSVHLVLSAGELEIALCVSVALKQDKVKPGPDRGFLVDFDIYQSVSPDTESIAELIIRKKNNLFDYFRENYVGFISDVLSTFRISE